MNKFKRFRIYGGTPRRKATSSSMKNLKKGRERAEDIEILDVKKDILKSIDKSSLPIKKNDVLYDKINLLIHADYTHLFMGLSLFLDEEEMHVADEHALALTDLIVNEINNHFNEDKK